MNSIIYKNSHESTFRTDKPYSRPSRYRRGSGKARYTKAPNSHRKKNEFDQSDEPIYIKVRSLEL